jgi:hypothetical protein
MIDFLEAFEWYEWYEWYKLERCEVSEERRRRRNPYILYIQGHDCVFAEAFQGLEVRV